MNATTDILQALSDLTSLVKWGGVLVVAIQLATFCYLWRKTK